MKSTPWLWLFGLAVATDLAAIYFQWNEIRYFSKPLIVLSLLIFFFVQPLKRSGVFLYIQLALFFSLAGDAFLLLEDKGPIFFMLGLGSFLVAHIFYILAFLRMRTKAAPVRWSWIVAVAIYGSTLLYVLLPYLGELKIPVALYAFVLCLMLLSVAHAFRQLYARPGIICLAGALLFVISDSALAINKFYFGFPLAGLLIMFTYALAQYLLVTGSVKFLRNSQTAIA